MWTGQLWRCLGVLTEGWYFRDGRLDDVQRMVVRYVAWLEQEGTFWRIARDDTSRQWAENLDIDFT